MSVGGQGAQIVSSAAGRIVVNLTQSAADLLTTFGAGAKVYLERDTTSAFASPTVVTSTVIVSGTEQYEFVDTSGTSASFYRVRVGNTGGTIYSEYSDGVQSTSLRAYASLDDLKETMNFGVNDTSKDNLLSDLLIDASAYIDRACNRDFYRHPQVSGTESRTFHVLRPNERSLARALGYGLDVVSITTFELADSTGSAYNALTAGSTGYWLEPQNPDTGWPFEDVLLSNGGSTYRSYRSGERTVRITGVFGWASVPSFIKRATIDLAREWYRQGPGGGGPIGTSILGAPIFQRGNPPTVSQAISLYKRRDFLHV